MIRILLAHPSRLVGDSLRAVLDNEPDVYVIGCATTVEELHFLLPHGNVVLLGTEMGNTSATVILDDIRMTHPHSKVVIMSVDESPESILRYIEAGASGYILQNESVEEMVEKLQAAHEENQEIADKLFIECGTVKNHVHNILKKGEILTEQTMIKAKVNPGILSVIVPEN